MYPHLKNSLHEYAWDSLTYCMVMLFNRHAHHVHECGQMCWDMARQDLVTFATVMSLQNINKTNMVTNDGKCFYCFDTRSHCCSCMMQGCVGWRLNMASLEITKLCQFLFYVHHVHRQDIYSAICKAYLH